MTTDQPPSRALLIVAGVLNQLAGAALVVVALVSLIVAHDVHGETQALVASVVAALAAIVCGTLMFRGRLVPLALAMGVDVGFGVALPRGGSVLGVLLRILPPEDVGTAEAVVTAAAIAMFVAAITCAIALPSALKLRRWAREEIEAEPLRPAETLKGIGPQRLRPSQIVHPGSRRRTFAVVFGVAVTLIALGVAVISAVGGRSDAGSAAAARPDAALRAPVEVAAAVPPDAAVPPVDAAVAVDAPALLDAGAAATLDDFLRRFHEALHDHDAELAALIDSKAFAFGVEAHEVVQGRDAVIAVLHHAIGGGVEPRFSQATSEGDTGWIAEELRAGGRTLVVTLAVERRVGGWSIAALHVALPMANDSAYRLAHDGGLAVPDAIPDTHDATPLAEAMRAAFASRPSFVEARSLRPDAFNFGSALGERIAGGTNIKKMFGRLGAAISLHDAVAVGALGDHAGWGAANVDFVDHDRDGNEVTQTFRVLAVWLAEPAGWRIVQTQWSNAR